MSGIATPKGPPLLEVRGLAIGVAGRTLAQGLDLAAVAGECWAIVGPNGAGKTTLVRALAGLAPPLAGEILYAGTPLPALRPRERARRRAWLPQDTGDPFPTSVLETVLVGRHPHVPRFGWETAVDVAIAREALARFALDGLEARDVRTLSGGERRRVALAAMLAQDPSLFLLDEPSSHLDVAQQVAALEVVASHVRERGRAALMVLHDLHLAARFCDRAIAIGGGRAFAGPIDAVLDERALRDLFGRPLVALGEGRGRAFVPR